MLCHNCIQLRGNLRKLLVQIERFHGDLVAAHLITVVRLDCLICCGIEKHSGNLMRLVAKLGILILDLCKNLIQIAGVQRMCIKNRLYGAGIIFRINNQHIPHHFAAAEEGRKLMLANIEYYSHFTQNDIDFRLELVGGTMDELLAKSADNVKEFILIDKYSIDRRFAKMSRTLRKNGYQIPKTDELVLIAADMALESGANGYTHGTEIYLNGVAVKIFTLLDLIPGQKTLDELLWHELFHCLTRCDAGFRAQM